MSPSGAPWKLPPDSTRPLHSMKLGFPSESMIRYSSSPIHKNLKANPLVTGPAHIRYYCGVPIAVQGVNIGALCLIDTEPKPALAGNLKSALQGCAAIVAREISVRKILNDTTGMFAMSLRDPMPKAN